MKIESFLFALGISTVASISMEFLREEYDSSKDPNLENLFCKFFEGTYAGGGIF